MREINDWDRLYSEGRTPREASELMHVSIKRADILLNDAAIRHHQAQHHAEQDHSRHQNKLSHALTNPVYAGFCVYDVTWNIRKPPPGMGSAPVDRTIDPVILYDL